MKILNKVFIVVLFSLFVGIVGVSLASPSKAQATSEPKIDICHNTGSGWNFMDTPAGPSLDGHLGHGDFLYTGPVDLDDKDAWCTENAPEVPTGSLKICKIITDSDDNVVAGESGSTFTISFSPTGVGGDAAGVPDPVTFDTPLTNLETLFGNVEGECQTIDNLAFGKYYYNDEEISDPENWEIPKYYDSHGNSPVLPSSFGDFDLRIVTPVDNPEYDNFDGSMRLNETVTTRTLFVLNQMKEEPEVTQQCDVVSDVTNIIEEGTPAVETWVHPAWVQSIGSTLAKWIWNSEYVVDPLVDETETFTKTFTVGGPITSANIQISADNGYILKINGNIVIDKFAIETNYSSLYNEDVLSYLVDGVNTIEFTVKNFALAGSTSTSNPAGLLYDLTIISETCSNESVVVDPELSNVVMCKIDDQQNSLSGWQLMLLGEKVGETDVLPDGTNYNISNVPAGNYVVLANGEYVYRPGSVGAEYSDAAYSKRAPGDAVYVTASSDPVQSAYLPWVRENNFPSPHTGWLGIIMNNLFTDWGSMFNPTHTYALGTTLGTVGDLSFKILDDQYSDNSGNLTVDVYKGYTGITEDDGCVAFEDVPYGEYIVDEILQNGWSNVSGLGEVIVDETEETFTVVNHDTSIPDDDPFLRSAEIIDPLEGENVSGLVSFTATLTDEDNDDSVQWAVRKGTCTAGTNTVFGNVDGYLDSYSWDNINFEATTDVSSWDAGLYCFIFNPSESLGDTPIRETREFNVVKQDEEETINESIVVKLGDLASDISDVISDVSKWFFYNDETDVIDITLGSFVSGPETAPLGDGSAEMTVSGTERRNIATYQFKDVKLADITELSFSTYSQLLGDGANGLSERAPYLNFNVDFDNSDTWQKRLVFVPRQNGTVISDTWQTWDAIDNGNALWSYSGSTWPTTADSGSTLKTWSQILALYPNAETRSTDSWFGFRLGEPYSNGFTGNVDNFVIGIKDGLITTIKTFDFEPTVENTSESVVVGCMDSGANNYNSEATEDTTPTSCTYGGGSSVPLSFLGGGGSSIPLGQVLGASTTCGIYIDKYLRRGYNNDVEAVKLLQSFLNEHMDAKLKIDGIFGRRTERAVMAFQLKYASEILAPWGFSRPTGIFYMTTQTKVNNLMCLDLSLTIPNPLIPFENNPLSPNEI